MSKAADWRDELIRKIEQELAIALATKPFSENASRAGAAHASHYYRAALYRINRLIIHARREDH